MKTVVLGGGISALIAIDILGADNVDVIPLGMSRYYSYSPPLAPNYITYDDDTENYLSKFNYTPIIYKIAYSAEGELLYNDMLLENWLHKVHNNNIPAHTRDFWKNNNCFTVYDECRNLYRKLCSQYGDKMKEAEEVRGRPTRIKDCTIYVEGGAAIEYDRLISTIPLDALLKYLDYKTDLPSVDAYVYHVGSKSIDLEGASEARIVDEAISPHTCYTTSKDGEYLFVSSFQISQPGEEFMQYIDNFTLLQETKIENAIPSGPVPSIERLDEENIVCVGSNACWDNCLDVGSCIKRILKIQ